MYFSMNKSKAVQNPVVPEVFPYFQFRLISTYCVSTSKHELQNTHSVLIFLFFSSYNNQRCAICP